MGRARTHFKRNSSSAAVHKTCPGPTFNTASLRRLKAVSSWFKWICSPCLRSSCPAMTKREVRQDIMTGMATLEEWRCKRWHEAKWWARGSVQCLARHVLWQRVRS